MISAQYLPLKLNAWHFIDFMMSFVDIVNLLLYLSVVNCYKKKLHRFIKPQFSAWQVAWQLLRFWPKSQPHPLATRLQHVLLVFSRSKWNMKIQRGNQCIMLFTWEWCNLLLLDTRENANFNELIWHFLHL